MSELVCPLANVEEVFSTTAGAVYQCSRKNCFWLEYNQETTAFSVSDFFTFKKRIDAIDVEHMINDTTRSSDFEIIMPFRTERCFILAVEDVLQLRELLDGAKFMMELNSVVRTCLQMSPFAVFA
ncbi:hypothetical protein HX021_17930 [Sphingobacterium sp. N143]|uniref:DUF6686 family protein n=1 Tax=Sphingobacterium sp. N143 TaxID=2746727 RepID=UPI0025787F04|nr:DUF6686 family protein [Sphingobacterium sp. N143]MDM1296168.1 hypothetical protein [Sphingobacterium sp. N143]